MVADHLRLGEYYASLNHDIECTLCGARYERAKGPDSHFVHDHTGRWYHWHAGGAQPCVPLEGNGSDRGADM